MTKISETIADLTSVTNDVDSKFGGLSDAQLNWRPGVDSWSVAQCLDHLILTNDQMTGAIRKVADATHRGSFWENWSPMTSFIGNFLIRSMRGDDKKFKVPSQTIAPPSEIGADIVARFKTNNDEMIALFEKLESVDLDRTVITSPFMGLMTYRLSAGLTILAEHEKRHVRQAERVVATAGFPA